MSSLGLWKIFAVGTIAWWSGAAMLFFVEGALNRGIEGAIGGLVMSPLLAFFGWPYLLLALVLVAGLSLVRTRWPTGRWPALTIVLLGMAVGAALAILQVGFRLDEGIHVGFWTGSLTAGMVAGLLVVRGEFPEANKSVEATADPLLR